MNYICKCSKSDFLKHNFTYWEDRDTTSDELEIINFLENSYKLVSKQILHMCLLLESTQINTNTNQSIDE